MKKKIGILFLFVSLLCIGSAYAFTSSGESLQRWYHQSFLKNTDEIGTSTTNNMLRGLKELSTEVKGAITRNEGEIDQYREKAAADSEKEIIKRKAQYIQELQESSESLKQNSKEKMQTYTKEKIQKEQTQLTDETEEILNEVLTQQK